MNCSLIDQLAAATFPQDDKYKLAFKIWKDFQGERSERNTQIYIW